MFWSIFGFLTLFSTIHTRAEVFVGCFRPEILPEEGGVVYDNYLDICPDLCSVNGTTYSHSWPDPDDHTEFPELSICQCGFSQPSGEYLVPVSLCDYPNVSVYFLPSPSDWSYSGCLYKPGHPDNKVSSLLQCLTTCTGFPTAFTVYNDSGIFCACSPTIPNSEDLQTVCGLEDWFVYSETIIPSGFVKKKREHQGVSYEALCPVGSQACRISSIQGKEYECTNTNEEMESCGGCLFGSLELDKSSMRVLLSNGTGIDCTSLNGVRPDGVTCNQGQCVVFACNEGYFLAETKCEAI